MQHNTGDYLLTITNQYTRKPPRIRFDEQDVLQTSNFVRPTVNRLEVHHQEETTALSLEGENLCFVFKIIIHLKSNKKEHEIVISQKESLSSRSIQIKNLPPSLTSDFPSSSDSSTSTEDQESDEKVNLHLVTHFGKFSFEDMTVKHKVGV